MNQAGAFTKSPSKSRSPSPTYNGYACFTKVAVPVISSEFIKPPHMNDPDYFKHHATKPAIDHKFVALNDLEEPIKYTILSDIERDQRLQQVKESIERSREQTIAKQAESDRKRKADHLAFDSFVKKSGKEMSDLQVKYNDLFGRYTKLQKEYSQIDDEHVNCSIKISGGAFENVRLQTLLDMKDREIVDLKETLSLYKPHSPPDFATLASIMDPPHLDLKESATVNDFHDFTFDENPNIDLHQEYYPITAFPSSQLAQPDNNNPRVYTKKVIKIVTDPDTLHALHSMARGVYSYSRKLFQGVNFNGTRYAFYFGRINSGGAIGLVTNIVLSSEQKVYNISNIDAIVEMSWNQDITSRGKKRGYGHIYLGAATGAKGFETNLKDVFQTELGVII